LSTEVILILGFSSKIADALAMGLGDALSTKAEHEHIFNERQREYWEYDNFPEGEVTEMVDMYVAKGMSREDAELCIGLMSEHRDFFVDVMMVEELGLQVPSADDNPWKDGFITFVSFIFFGFFPLLGYCIFPFAFPHLTPHTLFFIACVCTGSTLFLLGAIKSNFSQKTWYMSGLEMLLVGGSVAVISYGIGAATDTILETYFNLNPEAVREQLN